MPDNQKLAQLLEAAVDVQDLIRRAFNAGIEVGIEQEKARVSAALGYGTPALVKAKADEVPAAEAPANQKQLEYGAITNPIRVALRQIGSEGASAKEIAEYCHRWPSAAQIDVGQVRTALKILTKRGEAQRLARGKYAQGPKMAPEQASFVQ